MDPAHFRMLINDLWNKDPDVDPEHEPLIILDSKSDICMAKNGKETKHTKQIVRRMHFLINVEEWNFNNTVWC